MLASITQIHNLPSKPNVLKNVAYTLVPPLVEFSFNPSSLKFTPIYNLGKAKQRLVGVNTTFAKFLDVIMGVANKRGKMDGSKKIGGDEIEDVLGHMQGLTVVEVQQLVGAFCWFFRVRL
jgi:hypothetical protein